MSTNSRIGKISPSHKQVLPWKLKSVSQTRQDIQSWRRALAMFQNVEQPANWVLQLLYNNIKLDALLTSQIENRKDQTFSSEFVIKTADDKDDEEATKALANSTAFSKIIDAILDSKFHGYSMVELHIDKAGTLCVDELPRTNIIPQTGMFFKDYMEVTGGVAYREIKEYGTFIIEFNNLSMHEQEFGLLNKIVPHVLMKRFAQSCWSELCEIYGIPPRYMKTMTNDPSMMARAEQMMRDMGAAAWFIIDKEEELQFAQGVSTNGDVYKQFINLCNNEISLLITGAIIGQDTVNGSRSKDEANQEMLWQKVLADQRFIVQIINEKVMPALARHGLVKEGSYLKYNEAEDINKLFEFTTKLLTYKDVPNDWIEEKFGVPVIDKAKVEEPTNEDPDKEKEKKLSATLPSNFFD
ncbi:phage portal protein family protein [Sphingobacterium luzhongxinii]|uniref:phage portal protein family protein n=1 Tax=Sphingobacterium luzhongxinii TaxID=2654181 RepID=UPI0013DAD8BD|nr:DUF935 family protein [Sphingobacterium sp. xlx-73]